MPRGTVWSWEASRGRGAVLHDPLFQIIGRLCASTWSGRTRQEEHDSGT